MSRKPVAWADGGVSFLTADPDGDVYGVSRSGGPFAATLGAGNSPGGVGTIFRIGLAGKPTLTTLDADAINHHQRDAARAREPERLRHERRVLRGRKQRRHRGRGQRRGEHRGGQGHHRPRAAHHLHGHDHRTNANASAPGGAVNFTSGNTPSIANDKSLLVTLSGTGVKASNNVALFATDSAGTVRLLARTGNDLDLGGGVQKTLRLITTLGPVLDAPGQGRSANGNDIAARVTYTDGAQRIVRITVP